MTTLTPTQVRIAREACACPDCGKVIWRGSVRCMSCHHAARKAARQHVAPTRALGAGGAYIRIAVPRMRAGEAYGDGGDPYRDHALTWACPSPAAADAMAAAFDGRVDDVPSRRAFAPMPWEGLAARMTEAAPR